MRHPRYVMFMLIAAGNVFITGYPLVVVSLVVCVILFALVIMLEERELARHFGPPYQRYREQVPAFWPRRKGPVGDAKK